MTGMGGMVGTSPVAVSVEGLQFEWPGASGRLLDIPRWELRGGTRVLVLGPSGSGKSTLLSLLAGVRISAQGRVAVMGADWAGLPSGRRDAWRADHVGYVFQQFNLLPYLSALDNVTLPCRFSRSRRQRAGDPARAGAELLAALGLPEGLWSQRADQLSVGQQQRVAAARALIGKPGLVIADEPTSALDDDTRDQYMQVLLEACETAGAALVFVSHDRRLRHHFDRVCHLDHGRWLEETA
jgi:putative ABC transport system ATP-binding protein